MYSPTAGKESGKRVNNYVENRSELIVFDGVDFSSIASASVS